MNWGVFGPVQWRTRGGGRVMFVGMWLIIPSFALSLISSAGQAKQVQEDECALEKDSK